MTFWRLPGSRSSDKAAFALATWGVGAHAEYGIPDDLALLGRGMVSAFEAELGQVRMYKGRDLDGRLRFQSTHVHLEAGLRYKLYAGYNLAPYVEVLGGFLWSTVRDQDFLNDDGKSYGLDLSDSSEGAWTIAGGRAVDYRVWNLFLIGTEIRYVEAFGAMYRRAVTLPVEVRLIW